ncbi:hypothetical protein VTL71DRAFT_4044 [Oculimacula yallundae]|uniref:Uncharacterized protein n=1 Tax=Oculimacula yallundae TaxID=86028 RepID=A0ABR4C4R9_9HELO
MSSRVDTRQSVSQPLLISTGEHRDCSISRWEELLIVVPVISQNALSHENNACSYASCQDSSCALVAAVATHLSIMRPAHILPIFPYRTSNA